MKKIFSTLLLSLVLLAVVKGQNTFPASGNVGIGTTSPGKALEVMGDISLPSINGNKQIYTWSSSDANWRIGMSASPGFTTSMTSSHVQYLAYGNASGQGFAMGVNGSQSSFEITGSNHNAFFRGNVGIGTATPTSKLEVYQSTTNSTQNVGLRSWTGNSSGYYGNTQLQLAFGGGAGSFAHAIKSRHNSSGISGNAIDFYLWQPGDNVNGEGSLNVMTLNGTNVGIGTTAPAYRLDVNGSINASSILINGAPFAGGGSQWITSGTSIYYNASGNVGIGTSSPTGKLNVYNSGPTQIIIGNPNTASGGFTSLIAGTSADSNGYGYLQAIQSSGTSLGGLILNKDGGNVGIGTISPDAKLAVKGQVHAQEVRVDLQGAAAPDYVFESSYKLLSLQEVKDYISANKHLPEVPSAKEIEKNGVQLGEMNLLLLKKVEELTLYILEQEKRIKALETGVKEK